MSPGSRPVFFDPSARRWRHITRVAVLLTSAVLLLLGTIVVGVIVNPGLPSFVPPSDKTSASHRSARAQATTSVREEKFRAARSDLRRYLQKSAPPRPTAVSQSKFERIAFFVNWDDNSWVSLKRNLADVDTLIPEWLHLVGGNGDIGIDDEARQRFVQTYLHHLRPDLKVVALINNFMDNRWNSAALKSMLSKPESRKRAIDGIENYLHRFGLQGVSIDFEAVPTESQPQLLVFMHELYARFHAEGLQVSQSVPLDDGNFNFKALSAANDYLILMAYDENAADNDAGPIASQEWFSSGVADRCKEVAPEKLVIGIGSYGYDWPKGKAGGEELSFQDALRIASESEGDIQLDDASGNPTFQYYDEKNVRHAVWYLDGVTAFNELKAVASLNPRGFALWRLGSEDPGIWAVLRHPSKLDGAVAHELESMRFEYDVDYEGKGEILRVQGTPGEGLRRVSYDSDIGFLTEDEIQVQPRGFVIHRWGFDPGHVVALTFDDGPDPQWTAPILDILKREHVPATFFIIGENAEAYPRLVDRIAAEGHEVGNHTFTHPNIAEVSDRRIALELNATQRFLESRIGARSLLFRPPYAEDVEPETPDQVHPLVVTSALGYYSVGMQIDPNDWARPGTEAIVRSVLQQAAEGAGNVVLLHDSGGDRSQTVEALPKIIEALRDKGYRFVTVSQLLGVPRSAVMPPVDERSDPRLWMETAGFSMLYIAGSTLGVLFVIGIVLALSRFVLILGLALRRGRRRSQSTATVKAVSVIVPAHNEERLIEHTVRTLLASEGIEFEILVVDDGSTDATASIVASAFGSEPKVRLISQANAGKAEALNQGIREARHEIVIGLDADTIFAPQTLLRLAQYFADASIGAVAGNAKVGNRINLLTRWQALEYVTSQNLDRRAFEVLNCITVVPGAVGAWRREAIAAAGGFVNDTLAEDADLTMRIVRAGYRVAYDERALAYTEAPQSFSGFVKQRFRWMFGTLQACWKHRSILFRPSGGTLGFIALPNVLIFQILFPLISPVMDLAVLWTMVSAGLTHSAHPQAGVSPSDIQTFYYYGLFLVIDLATAASAYLFEPDEDWSLLPWLPLQRFCYRQLMYYVAIKSLVAALRGPRVSWGRLQRHGTVKARA